MPCCCSWVAIALLAVVATYVRAALDADAVSHAHAAIASLERILVEDLDNFNDASDPCHASNCHATFSSYGEPVAMPCSLASGKVTHSLPLAFPGNADLCGTFEFAGAHYCTIRTGCVASARRAGTRPR